MRAGVQRARPRSRGRDPGTKVAATTKKAADDGSPGISSVNDEGTPRCTRVVTLSTTSTGAPRYPKIRSVWSRLGAGSTISVTPSACSPARISAVFTWPLATASSWRTPCNGPPWIRSGAWLPPSFPVDVGAHRPERIDRHAPSAAPTTTRRRRARCGTDGPRTLRRGTASWCRSCRSRRRPPARASASTPCPSTTTRPSMPSRVATPNASIAARVRGARPDPWPGSRARSRRRPSRPTTSARCDTPLQPGTRTVPRSGDPPCTDSVRPTLVGWAVTEITAREWW